MSGWVIERGQNFAPSNHPGFLPQPPLCLLQNVSFLKGHGNRGRERERARERCFTSYPSNLGALCSGCGALLSRSGDWTENSGGPSPRSQPGCPTPPTRPWHLPHPVSQCCWKLNWVPFFYPCNTSAHRDALRRILLIWRNNFKRGIWSQMLWPHLGRKAKHPVRWALAMRRLL